jgi:hypothetical protein
MHARRALDEARQRGWAIHLAHGWPELQAPVATLSPSLVDRLCELADVLVVVLAEEQQ